MSVEQADGRHENDRNHGDPAIANKLGNGFDGRSGPGRGRHAIEIRTGKRQTRARVQQKTARNQ